MIDYTLEQALFDRPESGRCRLLAQSPGFSEVWQTRAEEICEGFGPRPEGVSCPECVFAYPLVKGLVAVVQAADRAPQTLTFHFLVIPLAVYANLIGDPFQVAQRFPAPWQARGNLPPLTWPEGPPAPRTVEQLQSILQRGGSPLLLGAVQALVDGSRLVFERGAPDSELLHSLWTLLPDSLRAELLPASFAFGNALRFDAVVVPRIAGAEFDGYLTAEQAENYPEGRYELNLQIAVEAGDQRELDGLFARRSHRQTLRLGLFILAAALGLLVLMYLLKP